MGWHTLWIRMGGIVILLLLGWHLFQAPPPLASDRLESRVNQLEFDLRQVRSQLNRLESSLGQVSPSRPTPISPPDLNLSPSLNDPSLEQQFDNLATLAIELKLQLRQLEDRVDRLEGH